MFVTLTLSASTIVSWWIPLRTRLSAHHDPTPPTPKIITRFRAMRAIASLPSSSSLLRNIALSIPIVHILGCKITAFSPNNHDNCHKINEIPCLWYTNATHVGLWESKNRRTFAPSNLLKG
jgi:hypothetical protein